MRGRILWSLGALVAAALTLLPPDAARAADWPTRPVRIIVPFGASGVTDIVTRIVFDEVGRQRAGGDRRAATEGTRSTAGATQGVGARSSTSPDRR